MPKYTIKIADIDIAVNTAESPETVDTLVGLIDRRIHDIIAKSPRCTKSEAAILCALDYCAEMTRNENHSREVERDFIRISKELEALKAEHATLTAEADELRRSNRVMHDILSNATAANLSSAPVSEAETDVETVDDTPLDEAMPAIAEEAPAEEAPAVFPALKMEESLEAESEDDSFEADATDMVITRRSRRSAAKPGNKSKVGDMFDLLTFKDI